ncbi:MAG: lamin tail domain-containing protein [Bacteroidia bacterium]|nr:lamin tail domain-containing protein [Bacteroidia bacterium]
MKYVLYPILSLLWLNPLVAQVFDDFSDGNFTHNPSWFGQDSLFQINAAKQLQSRSYNNSVGPRILYTIQTPEPNMEWRVWLRIAFNPSSQNYARWILCAGDSSLKNSYYVQLGGATGNLDSISLYKEVNGQRTCIIPGRPSTLGKTNNWVQLKVTRDTDGIWQMFTDTAQSGVFIMEGSAMDTSIQIGPYHGFFFQCTAGNVSNFYADDVYAGKPIVDKTPPYLKQLEISNPTEIKLVFSEKIQAIATQNIWFSQGQKASASSSNQIEWLLTLEDSLRADSFFVLGLNQLQDISGNAMDTQLTLVYHIPTMDEVLITEFMPDPEPVVGLPNAEFVELYNNSRFPINLSDFSLGDAGLTSKIPAYIIMPFSYLIFCAAKDTALYKPFGNVLGLNPWPSLNNSSDTLRLFYKQKIWQEIAYDLSYYNHKEKELGGYSLSMLNPFHTCYKKNNWMASNHVLGGSPGTENPNWTNIKDSSKAELLQTEISSQNSIELSFNKDISMQSTWQNYLHLQGIEIEKVEQDINQQRKIQLHFTESFEHEKTYTFQLYPVEDCLQNKSTQQVQFTYLEAKNPTQNQLLITEIYYDESRKGNFPQKEFIELYNASEHPVNLLNMQYSDATSTVKLPKYILPSKSYLIVCSAANLNEFLPFGKALGLSTWPSLNTSDQLSLRDSNGYLLHQVQYQDTWLKTTAKNFSCSIEMIDLKNPCAGANNWRASVHPNGASLGVKNSVEGINKDTKPPQLLRVYVKNAHQLQVQFTEPLDSLSLQGSKQFWLNQNIEASNFYFDPLKRNQVYINYEDSLEKETEYVLQILPIKDCAQNASETCYSLPFTLPKKPENGSIIINELLFNPSTDAVDFIELYNSSSEHIDISQLQLCRLDKEQNQEQYQSFAEEGIQLAPNEYLAISVQPEKVQNTSFYSKPENWVQHDIPGMSDDEGTILLINEENKILDSVVYSDKMHVSFLRNTEGVSLEKINPYIGGSLSTNWTSAAETENFSTPGKRNSQYKIGSAIKGNFSCRQAYFSPDMDGQDELLTFDYQTGDGIWLADLFIYNLQGQLIKEVCKSKLLANQGELHWMGDNMQGERAAIGNYIAYWNCYSSKGKTEQHKISIALLSK